MQIENHKEEVPFAHYCERFAALDPQEAAARTGTPFENGAFRITLLGHPYRITHPEFSISGEGGTALKSLPAQTFLMRWLLEGKQTAGSRDFLTFREMPWGELYIQPFTGRVLQRAAFSFGTRLEAFRAACTARPATQASSSPCWGTTACACSCGRATTNSRPAPSCSTARTLSTASRPRIASSQGTCCATRSRRICKKSEGQKWPSFIFLWHHADRICHCRGAACRSRHCTCGIDRLSLKR